ncbi:MAG: hypothetical protein HYW14_03445 [Planctomycetes bacterium]|nr:hypothetical protein [Planctomycetota bacterium]
MRNSGFELRVGYRVGANGVCPSYQWANAIRPYTIAYICDSHHLKTI